jgi:hypothetical protein
MATRQQNVTRPAAIGQPEVALGGAPLPEAALPPDHDKGARKQRKREAKQRRDAERPPESFERWRILLELVREGRQVVDLADHKARYSLVIMGVLNAGVFFLMSRAHLFGSTPARAKPWLIGFLVVYSALTFLFVYYAVDCLRPRQLRYADTMATHVDGEGRVPRGLLYWETIATYELEAYRRAWSGVSMEQLNAEVVVIAHHLSRMIRTKYVALGRLYWGMAALVVLAGILLAAFTVFGVMA